MKADARLATIEDLAPAEETLTVAFMDYPWTRWVIPEDDYAKRLRELQRLYLRHALRHGVVLVTREHAGAAALLPPDAAEPSESTMEQIIALHGERIGRLTGSQPAPGAWTLETLGVRPSHQGRGLGSALIAHALRDVSRRGAQEVRLETSDARNVRLYERHGFHVTSCTDSGGGPAVWAMTLRLTESRQRRSG
ncbi:GNAT family N-acetyltransferase [Streptomyces prasinopilosus]|uniref:Acetyltransferase (GNAT) family protein n=1 Tax=Streptomyces prasinopilosus TaxID=67344 RepID=A0A1G6XTG5_9ACTN|nr:GNAT family N-acetyltransferase [Streptomyces prasinopilosus]SDD81271.1 Acetyltransferase (GNAT) family protein [Streptomyces prasinopilosus]